MFRRTLLGFALAYVVGVLFSYQAELAKFPEPKAPVHKVAAAISAVAWPSEVSLPRVIAVDSEFAVPEVNWTWLLAGYIAASYLASPRFIRGIYTAEFMEDRKNQSPHVDRAVGTCLLWASSPISMPLMAVHKYVKAGAESKPKTSCGCGHCDA